MPFLAIKQDESAVPTGKISPIGFQALMLRGLLDL
jgi:hypothetical protein